MRGVELRLELLPCGALLGKVLCSRQRGLLGGSIGNLLRSQLGGLLLSALFLGPQFLSSLFLNSLFLNSQFLGQLFLGSLFLGSLFLRP